ncbi:DSS1/SEM1 family protein [Cordyceps fumosorosea ARSEF 2679]|uniref:26S proteasome complex subunit SEM1 n=1 Tax=Cordyceps fumosorosea (strain ARSEF 2679) TaxID=1081104 RepID=A0A167LP34_CORFA|nr:DSS1/SEM1 family protein [Cordyceps fumosorosea ARSEF 2679]OAA53321.1 DSS1/SEM1 family protein [Cordyceps fumosorosea ARSEF 2679]
MATEKTDDKPTATAATEQPPKDTKATALGEDDEFEDFPVDDWPEDQTEAAQGSNGQTKHLWEESWDDDDTTDDFSTQLKCVQPAPYPLRNTAPTLSNEARKERS